MYGSNARNKLTIDIHVLPREQNCRNWFPIDTRSTGRNLSIMSCNQCPKVLYIRSYYNGIIIIINKQCWKECGKY